LAGAVLKNQALANSVSSLVSNLSVHLKQFEPSWTFAFFCGTKPSSRNQIRLLLPSFHLLLKNNMSLLVYRILFLAMCTVGGVAISQVRLSSSAKELL